ncbi:hypothetical protein B4113_2031 [Geobacillus sp. B4113_201601]|nr:hypothetical protein B4113_2031 [Geobacillus sp. B4113_201601]
MCSAVFSLLWGKIWKFYSGNIEKNYYKKLLKQKYVIFIIYLSPVLYNKSI